MELRKNKLGGGFWILGSVVFVTGMVVTQIGYGPSYSLIQNHISDLGAVHCGLVSNSTSQTGYLYNGTICSPWHDVFNMSIIVDGILLVPGVVLTWTSFPTGKERTIGLGLLLVAGVGSFGVGLFPEDVNILAHSLSALLVFVPGNIAIILLGLSMSKDPNWNRCRTFSILSGLIGLVAFGLFLSMLTGPLGVGGMERLIVAPLLVWTVVVSIHLARLGTQSFSRPPLG